MNGLLFPPSVLRKQLLACSLLLPAFTCPAASGGNHKPYSPGWAYQTNHVRVDVRKDGSSTTHREYAIVVLSESAAKSLNEQSISYHEGGDVLKNVVAYTLKKDGRRLPVPDTNIQVTSHNGIDGAPPAFSDYKDRHIIYPGVEVGDTIVLSYTIEHRKPTFPNHFSLLTYYSDKTEYRDAKLVVTAPKSMGLTEITRNLPEPSIRKLGDGRQQWTWTYKNLHPKDVRTENLSFQRAWHYRDLHAVEMSNFRNYGEIAAAYDARAAKLSAINPRIRQLSEKIVKGAGSDRAKARRIYQWIADNISFAGNCLAGGDVVPRTTDLVLTMKMGDCKDHATLMQAMLAAQGIRSTQVLINSGYMYELPKVPCWQAFNHVINYLPEYDIYLDSTSTSTSFGALPLQDYGKPVIRTSSYDGIDHTPALAPDANWSVTNDIVKVHSNGSIDVVAKYRFVGSVANSLSQRFTKWRQSPAFDGGTVYFAQKLAQYGYKGTGSYDHVADSDGPTDKFSFGAHYHIDDYLDTSDPYGVALSSFFPSPDPISEMAVMAAVDHYDHDFLCYGDRKTEQISYAFPDNVELVAVPHDVHVHTAALKYDATYVLRGNTVTVKRTMVDDSPGPVCGNDMIPQYQTVGRAIKHDIKAEAIYQPRRR